MINVVASLGPTVLIRFRNEIASGLLPIIDFKDDNTCSLKNSKTLPRTARNAGNSLKYLQNIHERIGIIHV
jgi:hypothetical protein